MKLNDIDVESYILNANRATFVLNDTTLSAVLALDGSDLTLVDDTTDTQVLVLSGYSIASVEWVNLNQVAMHVVRKLDDRIIEAINGLDTNVQLLNTKMDRTETVALNAKAFAETHGMPPSVKAAAAMMVSNSTIISNSEIGDISDLIPAWRPDISYKQGQLVKYDNKVYRLAQDTTSSDIFKPGEGTESIYTLIDIAEDGVRIWHMPTDATNSFALNELAHYPTASDPIYRSKRNGNTSEPTKDAWWELAE